MTNFDEIKSIISPELKQLEEIIDQSLTSNSPLLNEIVKMYLKTKGKQIRPIVVILSAIFFAAEANRRVLHGAAAIELLHNASLIHDDVVDETKKRRGQDTINSVWDNHVAVSCRGLFRQQCACMRYRYRRLVRHTSDFRSRQRTVDRRNRPNRRSKTPLYRRRKLL